MAPGRYVSLPRRCPGSRGESAQVLTCLWAGDRAAAGRHAVVMASDVLRIGIVGASPGGSWGTFAHIPALTRLPEFQVTAVCNARRDSAATTAQRCGAHHVFDDVRRLAEHPEVDAVAICVRVPRHKEL